MSAAVAPAAEARRPSGLTPPSRRPRRRRTATPDDEPGALAVFRNRPFLLLWLAQAATQIGGNMVLFGLTVIILEATSSNTAVSLLILTFLVPAVLFSAVAGVYVDRLDRRLDPRSSTNVLRGAAFVAPLPRRPTCCGRSSLLNIVVSTITVFFGPAEAAMIPSSSRASSCSRRTASSRSR